MGTAPRSLDQLHDDWSGPLHAFAMRRLAGDREAAEEVVQDTLLRAWQHRDRFDPARGTEAAWLFTIARNLIVDRYRRRMARPVVARDLVPGDEVADEEGLEVDRLLETWQVADALAALTPEHRDALLLCHWRGHSVAEAARILDVPEGTVKSRVHYGLRAIRLRLEEQGVIR